MESFIATSHTPSLYQRLTNSFLKPGLNTPKSILKKFNKDKTITKLGQNKD